MFLAGASVPCRTEGWPPHLGVHDGHRVLRVLGPGAGAARGDRALLSAVPWLLCACAEHGAVRRDMAHELLSATPRPWNGHKVHKALEALFSFLPSLRHDFQADFRASLEEDHGCAFRGRFLFSGVMKKSSGEAVVFFFFSSGASCSSLWLLFSVDPESIGPHCRPRTDAQRRCHRRRVFSLRGEQTTKATPHHSVSRARHRQY